MKRTATWNATAGTHRVLKWRSFGIAMDDHCSLFAPAKWKQTIRLLDRFICTFLNWAPTKRCTRSNARFFRLLTADTTPTAGKKKVTGIRSGARRQNDSGPRAEEPKDPAPIHV